MKMLAGLLSTALFISASAIEADELLLRANIDGQRVDGILLKVKPGIGDVFKAQDGDCFEVIDVVWDAYTILRVGSTISAGTVDVVPVDCE